LASKGWKLSDCRLNDKQDSANDVVHGGKSYVASTNPAATTKTFDTSGLSSAELEKQVFGYADELAGGRAWKQVDAGVWSTKLADGTTVNVRSVSSSNVSRWTIDVQGSPALKGVKPSYKDNSYEIKFK
jgi:hypothetical protein